MNGIYLRTIKRDEKDGMTFFVISPTERCPQAKDGQLFCTGMIGFYHKQMPIHLEGHFGANDVFFVEKDELRKEPEADLILARYVDSTLSDAQLNKLLKLNGIFHVLEERNHYQVFYEILQDKKRTNAFIKKLKSIKDNDFLSNLLLQYKVPADRISLMIGKGVTYEDIKKDPYSTFLFYDISIYLADTIAGSMLHVQPYAPIRLMGYVKYAFRYSKSSGNTCCTPQMIVKMVNHLLSNSIYPETKINVAILNLCISKMKNEFIEYVSEHGDLYLYEEKIWQAESSLIRHLLRLQKDKVYYKEARIDEIEEQLTIRYTKSQRESFQALSTSGVKILTGPPGSGKTAVIKGYITYFEQNKGKAYKLAATTGRASQVMSNACEKPAVTVHKMIDIRPYDNGVSSMDLNNPIDADLLIIDEISMMDLQLAYLLFKAIRSGTTVILVGDEDQLQSVECGNVLADLIRSGFFEVYRLTEIMRQSGTICENAISINRGNEFMKLDDTFQLYEFKTEEEAKKVLLQNRKEGEQILTPIKKKELGTFSLNSLTQDVSGKACITYGRVTYYQNNKIIMLKTNYEKGYFNGEIGTVLSANEDKSQLKVDFGKKIIWLDRSDFYFMALANAITTHKSQGSEFETVHILLPDSAKSMMTRRMVYTAVTRAKKKVYIYSINHSFSMAVNNTQERSRISLLAERLCKKIVIH